MDFLQTKNYLLNKGFVASNEDETIMSWNNAIWVYIAEYATVEEAMLIDDIEVGIRYEYKQPHLPLSVFNLRWKSNNLWDGVFYIRTSHPFFEKVINSIIDPITASLELINKECEILEKIIKPITSNLPEIKYLGRNEVSDGYDYDFNSFKLIYEIIEIDPHEHPKLINKWDIILLTVYYNYYEDTYNIKTYNSAIRENVSYSSSDINDFSIDKLTEYFNKVKAEFKEQRIILDEYHKKLEEDHKKIIEEWEKKQKNQ